MTDDPECGCVVPAPKPKLRLARVDPMDPAQVVPWGPAVKRAEAGMLARWLKVRVR
jgi:hypothetical protein